MNLSEDIIFSYNRCKTLSWHYKRTDTYTALHSLEEKIWTIKKLLPFLPHREAEVFPRDTLNIYSPDGWHIAPKIQNPPYLITPDLLYKTKNKVTLYGLIMGKHFNGFAPKQLSLHQHFLKEIGFEIDHTYSLFLDPEYVLDENLTPEILRIIDCYKQSTFHLNKWPETLNKISTELADKIPPHPKLKPVCIKPNCPFLETCFTNIQETSILHLTGLSAQEKISNFHSGQESFLNYPHYLHKNKGQTLQIQNKDFINQDGLKTYLDTLKFPIGFIDFEAAQPILPLFKNTSTYAHIPYAASLHIQWGPDTQTTHHLFIPQEYKEDPRIELSKFLEKSLEGVNTLFAFNLGLEKRILEELSDENHPNIQNGLSILKDFATPFTSYIVYFKDMQGKFTIKAIANAILGKDLYSELVISHGLEAKTILSDLLFGDLSPSKKAELTTYLARYVTQDTAVMAKILKVLRKLN